MELRRAALESVPRDRTSLSRFFSDIRRYSRLSTERERSLAESVRAGLEAPLHELVQSNLAFVVKVATQYRDRGVPFEDLLNEGNLGLLEAARRYDATKGTKFITYAIFWIRKSILRALHEQPNLVRVPTNQWTRVREVKDAESTLRRVLGRRPRREEISAHLDRTVREVDDALQRTIRRVGLEDRVGPREARVADLLVDDSATSPEDDLMRREATDLVGAALARLDDQQREVIRYRFGMAGEPALTLQDTGRRMGLSRERVRQIECEAKRRLCRFCERRLSGRVAYGAAAALSTRRPPDDLQTTSLPISRPTTRTWDAISSDSSSTSSASSIAVPPGRTSRATTTCGPGSTTIRSSNTSSERSRRLTSVPSTSRTS